MLRSRLLREGSLGLFLLLGLMVFGGIVFFLKGGRFQQNSYQVKLKFENAGGLTEGGKVLYRGVEIGKIVAIQPNSNGIEVITEINSKLPIPNDVEVFTVKSGLLGEARVNMVPKRELTTEAIEINPLSSECSQKAEILCHDQVIQAESSPDLILSLTRLSNLYSDPALFENINDAIANIAIAGEKAAKLSDDLSEFMIEVKEDINEASQVVNEFQSTAKSISRTADTATEQINRLANEFSNTSGEIHLLVTNLNGVIEENQLSLSKAIVNISQTTKDVSQLAQNTDKLITKFDQSLSQDEVKNIIANLEKATGNFEQISGDLLALSEQINDPANLVTLQQTLDSARVTFANTAKITSDLDELTGDPQFRTNIRKLVNGLSNLVSYTELLEKQVQLAIVLESAQEIAADNSLVEFSQFKPSKPINLHN